MDTGQSRPDRQEVLPPEATLLFCTDGLIERPGTASRIGCAASARRQWPSLASRSARSVMKSSPVSETEALTTSHSSSYARPHTSAAGKTSR
ncbi:hypothetical protein ACFRQM_41170 [Streptomyces sp. NPDC056831]|uniref:hypothetical protein n=1 Tax=Streptomyces sp. NPDC056831 TaxID=3345954 RepID=UPI003676739A